MIEGSLEVKLPTIWTDSKAEVGRVREEKSRREKIREEKEWEERRCRCALKGASRLETCKPRGLRRGLHQEQTIMPALGQCFLILVDPSCLVFSFQSSSVSNGNPTDSPRQSSFLHFLADFRCFWLKNHMFICPKKRLYTHLVKSRHFLTGITSNPGFQTSSIHVPKTEAQ